MAQDGLRGERTALARKGFLVQERYRSEGRASGSALQTELGLVRQQALLNRHERARELRKEGRVAVEIANAGDVVKSTVTSTKALLGPALRPRVEVTDWAFQ